MDSLIQKRDALKTEMIAIDKFVELHEQVLTLLKGAGFETLDAYLNKLQSFAGKPAAPAKKKAATQPKAQKKAGGKRGRKPRITADQVAKMKSLREAGTPRSKIADQVGVSVGAVIQWEKKKFIYG